MIRSSFGLLPILTLFSSLSCSFSPQSGTPLKANAQEFKPEIKASEAVKDGKTLFVGNLPWSVEWSELKDYLTSEGHVTSGEILLDYQGRSKGFAIVQMASAADAKAVIGNCLFDSFLAVNNKCLLYH